MGTLLSCPLPMRARQVVLLTPAKLSGQLQLLSRQHFVPVSSLAATLMESPASVANKRLTARLNPLPATLTKNRGVGGPPCASDRDAHPASANGGGAEGFFSSLTLLHSSTPRVFHNSFTAKQFRTLSQNCRGVAQQFPFWELLPEHNAERPLFSSSPFNNLHTLPSSVSHKSFACHSYENCRVYTNNFHSGTRCSILLICCPSCSRIVRASIALRMGGLGPATSRRNS